MNHDELKKKLRELPEIPRGTIAREGQIIEGNEGGCHYKITKEAFHFPLVRGIVYPWVVYSLSVSGPEQGQKEIIAEFINILGSPSRKARFEEMPGITFVLWDANEIEGRL